jgi:thymidylate synthase (FAD)
MGNALTVVNAARVSFGNIKTTIDEKDKKLIKYLADHKHMSPFEHCALTVKITCPLHIRSQIHRHRTMAFNEISRRYTSKDLGFFETVEYRKQASSNRQASEGNLDVSTNEQVVQLVKKHHEQSLDLYNKMLDMGVCREQARGVLPQNLSTEFYATANLRNWAHFVSLREHEGAQHEVQFIAKQIKQILIEQFDYAASVLFNK